MDRFDGNRRIGGEELPQPGNKDIHTPAEEKIILPPDMQENLFPLQNPVRVFA